ncbi:hypothetical protein [Photobacterium damselae]|uniref:hypothetical protein n=1 Tax=Photobacterium damselae TaxID=38293 RepID=UPI001F29DE4C|nr:hypothetical protein [Photobacterium damselae]UKA29914.1 hypothetical protein IPQ37_04270 [Photobacterium damselae subsp. damselae]
MKIDIYSDVKYDYYQHINHILFDNLYDEDIDVRFLERFYMNFRLPRIKFNKENSKSFCNEKK